MRTRIGTCSICRGPVSIPTIFHSVVPPTPTCEQCGATEDEPHGPVINMKPDSNLRSLCDLQPHSDQRERFGR